MKKSLFSLGCIALLGSVLSLSSCSWQLPESAKVKTNASYEFGYGNVTQALGDDFDTSKLFSGMNDADKKAYDYNPASNVNQTQQFALSMKVKEFGDFNSGLNLLSDGTYESSTTDLSAFKIQTVAGQELELPFSFSEILSSLDNLGSDFGSKMELQSLPLYVYFKLPDGLKDVKLKNSKITFECKDSGGVQAQNAAGQDIKAEIVFTRDSVLPAFPADGEVMVIDISTLPCSGSYDLIDFANDSSKVTDCKNYISYHLEIDELTKEGTVSENFEIYSVIVMPLVFKTTSAVSIDMLEKAGKSGTDFFGRTEEGKSDVMEKMLEFTKEITLNYSVDELPVSGNMTFELGYKNKAGVQKSIKSVGDLRKGKLTINNYTFNDMLNVYPCEPSIGLCIGSGEIVSVKRSKNISMNLTMGLETDGMIDIPLGK